jgi:hypothetical protein
MNPETTSYTAYNVTQDKKRIAKRFIDPVNNKKDKLCIKLLGRGKAYSLIRRLTGYTNARIRARGNFVGIKTTDYRLNNKRSVYTKMVLRIDDNNEAVYDKATDEYLEQVCPELHQVVVPKRGNNNA